MEKFYIKHRILFLACLLALTGIAFIEPPNKLVGRWKVKTPPDFAAMTVYRSDGTIDVFFNGKVFVSGTYKFNKDTLLISDPICGSGYYGQYRIEFITEDSIRQIYLKDSCTVRRNSVASLPIMSRIKATKP